MGNPFSKNGVITRAVDGMHPFSKNGIITKVVEAVPAGGFFTAPIHAAAGNTEHALQATIAGFDTLLALFIAGPIGAVAVAAANNVASGLVTDFMEKRKKRNEEAEETARKLVEQIRADGVAQIFNECLLDKEKGKEAVRAAEQGDATTAGRILLEAGQMRIAESTNYLSAESGGRRCLKSVHGTYLRAIEPKWKVDLVDKAPKEWEQWYIEDWKGMVVLKGRGADDKPGQFLRAFPDGSVDLTEAHPKDDPLAIWKPFKNDNGSWSFLSVHGTWLSAGQDGSVSTVVKCDECEQFWLEKW